MSQFIRITSNGGYIGSFWWVNTGVHEYPDFWGKVFRIGRNILDVNWAGSLWPVRVFTANRIRR